MITRGMVKARTLAVDARAKSGAVPGLRLEVDPGKAAVLYVYEEIGQDYWTGEGVTAKNVIAKIADAKKVGCTSLAVRILSGGGDAVEGVGIYEALKRCGMQTTAYNDGLCASAATMVALGCDKVISAPTSTWMSHRAWTVALGNCDAMRAMADVLEKFDSAIAGAYAEKTGKTADECLAMMSAETWMTAEECKAFGFADEVARVDEDGACDCGCDCGSTCGSGCDCGCDCGCSCGSAGAPREARALARAERTTQERIAAHALRLRLSEQADKITRASPGSKERSGQPARK